MLGPSLETACGCVFGSLTDAEPALVPPGLAYGRNVARRAGSTQPPHRGPGRLSVGARFKSTLTEGHNVDRPNASGVKTYKARYAFTKTGELNKTVPLEPGESIVLEASIQSRSGRFTVGTGQLRLTDSRLLLLSHRVFSADRIAEIPRRLIRGIELVQVSFPDPGKWAIALSYEGEPNGGVAPFWASWIMESRFWTDEAVKDEDPPEWTLVLFDALSAALYPSVSKAPAAAGAAEGDQGVSNA